MADQLQRDSIDIFRRLIERRQVSVRYGRARLTVYRSGEWSERDLGPAIERFEEGEIDAEALAWAFIRNRVVKHTPSFSWDNAELSLLLDRVVGASTEPTFESSAPDDVAGVLVETARSGREKRGHLREESERWARNVSDRLGLASSLRPIAASMKKYGLASSFKGVIGLDSTIYESTLNGLAFGHAEPLAGFSTAVRRGKLAQFGSHAFGVNIWPDHAPPPSTQMVLANGMGTKINSALLGHPAFDSFAEESAEALAGLWGHPSFAAFSKESAPLLAGAGKALKSRTPWGLVPSTVEASRDALEVWASVKATGVLGIEGTRSAEELLSRMPGLAGSELFSSLGLNAFGGTGLSGEERWRDMASNLHLGVTRAKFPGIDTGLAAAALDSRFKVPSASRITTVEGPLLELPTPRDLAPVDLPVALEDESGLAEVTARAEARSNRHAAEALLRDEGMLYELEHLEAISDCLEAETKSGRVHAAMSASIVFKGIANAFFPGRRNLWVDRWNKSHQVDRKDIRNRIAAFIDTCIRAELSTHEHKRLQGMIDFSHNWSGEGHHTPYSADQANRAYLDLLVVLAYVARAWERSLR